MTTIAEPLPAPIPGVATRLVDNQRRPWAWYRPLQSWVCDDQGRLLLRSYPQLVTDCWPFTPFAQPEPQPEPVGDNAGPSGEGGGADRHGWIEPPGPVHNHDAATQVMPAVSPESCPPVKTSAVDADVAGGVARSA